MSMPKSFLGKSRTCPLLAATSKSAPRSLLIVLALAGDSTITRFFFFLGGTVLLPSRGLPGWCCVSGQTHYNPYFGRLRQLPILHELANCQAPTGLALK